MTRVVGRPSRNFCHELAEERERILLSPRSSGADPMGALSRTHAEIEIRFIDFGASSMTLEQRPRSLMTD